MTVFGEGEMMYTLWDRFASQLARVDEAPEPLCSTMQTALNPDDVIRLLVFGPANRILGKFSPPTLLAILDHEWILVAGTENDSTQAVRVAFLDTLLAELTIILLYGRLTFDYIANDKVCSVDMEFNTVMGNLYKQSARFILDGIYGIANAAPVENENLDELLQGLPMKFSNAVLEFKPLSQRVTALFHLSAVIGQKWHWFTRKLSPEGVLVLTKRELIYISEEKASSSIGFVETGKYGYILTYCPLSRLKTYEILVDSRLGKIEMKICARQRSETLKVEFSPGQIVALKDFLKKVWMAVDKVRQCA